MAIWLECLPVYFFQYIKDSVLCEIMIQTQKVKDSFSHAQSL